MLRERLVEEYGYISSQREKSPDPREGGGSRCGGDVNSGSEGGGPPSSGDLRATSGPRRVRDTRTCGPRGSRWGKRDWRGSNRGPASNRCRADTCGQDSET